MPRTCRQRASLRCEACVRLTPACSIGSIMACRQRKLALLAEQAKARPSLRQVDGLLAPVALLPPAPRSVVCAVCARVFWDACLLPTDVGPPRCVVRPAPRARCVAQRPLAAHARGPPTIMDAPAACRFLVRVSLFWDVRVSVACGLRASDTLRRCCSPASWCICSTAVTQATEACALCACAWTSASQPPTFARSWLFT